MPVMREQRYGRIVLLSSIVRAEMGYPGVARYPGLAHYSAAKAGMSSFMRTAALELAPFQVAIDVIEPGSVRPEGLADLGENAIGSTIEDIPLGSLGEARLPEIPA